MMGEFWWSNVGGSHEIRRVCECFATPRTFCGGALGAVVKKNQVWSISFKKIQKKEELLLFLITECDISFVKKILPKFKVFSYYNIIILIKNNAKRKKLTAKNFSLL